MKVTLDAIEPGDKVIAVLGAVGSGKTAFIDAATTSNGQTVDSTPEDSYGEVQVSRCLVSGISIAFIEVPSSEQVETSLVFMSKWLEKTYEANIKIAGIVYMHPINNIHDSLDSLPFFGSLSASVAFENIVLATSMWGAEANVDGHFQRERQLITEHWKPILDRGSTTVRFLNTPLSASGILKNIISGNRGGPASSIDSQPKRRIEAKPENGLSPHVSLLAALIQAKNSSELIGPGMETWREATNATLAIVNITEISQGHRRMFQYIVWPAVELLFAISEQVKAGQPYVEVADTVYYLNQQFTRLAPLTRVATSASLKAAQRWLRSHQPSLLRNCERHIEAACQFFEETTFLRLQDVIDRIEARLTGRPMNEYEPSLTESQFSSLESFTAEYGEGDVSHNDGARRMAALQQADKFLEIKYIAQTQRTLERLEALLISARLNIPVQSSPQMAGSTTYKTTILQASNASLRRIDRIAHIQQSINRVESFVRASLASGAAVQESPPKDSASVVAPIIVEPVPSSARSETLSTKAECPSLPKLVFDARLFSYSPKNSPATPTRWKSNFTQVDKGATHPSPVLQIGSTAYSHSRTTSFIACNGGDGSQLFQRLTKPSFSSLAPFIPEDSSVGTPTRWNHNLSIVDEKSVSALPNGSHSRSISLTRRNSDKLDMPQPFPSLGTPVSTSIPCPVDDVVNQPHARTTSNRISSSFSSLIGLYVNQLVETKEHVWLNSRETATVSIYVNHLLFAEGDHFHGTINGNNVGGVGNANHAGGDVFYGSIRGCNVGGRSNNNDVKTDLNNAVRVVADYKPGAA